jgi:hypothetical protein
MPAPSPTLSPNSGLKATLYTSALSRPTSGKQTEIPIADGLFVDNTYSPFRHLEGASGILSAVKAIMMIERKALLPNAGFEEFNKGIREREKLRVASCKLCSSLCIDMEAKTITGATNGYSVLRCVPSTRLRDQLW